MCLFTNTEKPSIIEKTSILGNENEVIERAKKLTQFYHKYSPIQSNPNTKAHLLV
jgi:hypothetical protein